MCVGGCLEMGTAPPRKMLNALYEMPFSDTPWSFVFKVTMPAAEGPKPV